MILKKYLAKIGSYKKRHYGSRSLQASHYALHEPGNPSQAKTQSFHQAVDLSFPLCKSHKKLSAEKNMLKITINS
jgi:hypothetical protein